MSPNAERALGEVLRSGHIAQGSKVDEFERVMGWWLRLPPSRLPIALNSGTSALHLAMHLAGVGPGDEVAVSPMTCAATIVPIIHLGAKPVWVDVYPLTGLMDEVDLAKKITHKTKAVVAIDWAGARCDFDAIRKVTSLPIIEDAAHAMFAMDELERTIAELAALDAQHYVCWSTQAIKTLTTGDGGLLLVPEHQQERARKLRWFGLDRTSNKDFRAHQDIDEAGYKFHMNDIAAAIGLANLEPAWWAVNVHRVNARTLYDAFLSLPNIAMPQYQTGSSHWIFTILVKDRESFQRWMKAHGIETSQVHRRCDEHPAFRRVAGESRLPTLDHFAARQISVPNGWWLGEADLSKIIEAVKSWALR